MRSNNSKKVLIVVFTDIVLFAALLLSFAWFHHAKPKPKLSSLRSFGDEQTAAPTTAPVLTETETPTVSDPAESADPSVTAEPTSEPTPEPQSGLLGSKFAEKFTTGDVQKTSEFYRSENVAIEISQHSFKNTEFMTVRYLVADIYIRDISSLRCAVSDDPSNKEWVVDIANKNNAILATSGDYFLFHNSGLAIRNGELLRDKLHPEQDVCVLYRDGTMETYLKNEIDLDYIYAKTPYQAWSFGPRLLENGRAMTKFNTSVADYHPRCAIGYYEPGHYCLVLVDGRDNSHSFGVTMQELSNIMEELNCAEAYNLDGGMTAMMAYDGKLISKPAGGGRKNCDIVYIGEPLS